MERLGFDPSRPLAVAALSGPEQPEALSRACEEVLARHTGPFLASSWNDLALVVLQPDGPGFLAGLRSAVAARTTGPILAGAGSLVPFDRLIQAVREARYALQVCRTEERSYAEFADLGTYQLLLSLQDPEALRTFADSVLAPLDGYDQNHGGELIPSLRAFLERNAGGRRRPSNCWSTGTPFGIGCARSRSSPGGTCLRRGTGWSSSWP